jgi:hypothetical protein
MIIYINKTANSFEITHSNNAMYQVIIPRVKTGAMSINKPDGKLGYKNINLTSKEAKQIINFIYNHFKEVVIEIDNLLIAEK